ncbi:bis-aminopropyl spermidine synthase family protein [Candidatus Bathyarchaeota archaeon]|nr:bis-aminopropyl spermidine synthase family protein [Candidatus Bathyarchaeota archaeon]
MAFLCRKCGNNVDDFSTLLCPDCYNEIDKVAKDILSNQPAQKRDIDQFGMNIDTLINHNLFLAESYQGKYAAFFGGYDGSGLLAPFFGEKGVLIIDYDEDVLNWWEKTGSALGYDVIPVKYDAREPINDTLFDCISKLDIDLWRTDPPFNCAGMFCFISRIAYLNSTGSPLYTCIPFGTGWSKLLKHQVHNFVISNGMKIVDVSPKLNNYTHHEGATSFSWKLENDRLSILVPNEKFIYNIYRPTPMFASSPLGCYLYDLCKSWRDEWDTEIENQQS